MLRLIRFLRHDLQTKPRVALAVALSVLAVTMIYIVTRARIYEATAVFVDPSAGITGCELTINDEHVPPEKNAGSIMMAGRVLRRLDNAGTVHRLTIEFLLANCRVTQKPGNKRILISFRHPEPATAAQVANFFVDELRTTQENARSENIRLALEDLPLREETQRRRVKAMEESLTKLNQGKNSAQSEASRQNLRPPSPDHATLERELNINQEILNQLIARRDEIEAVKDQPFYEIVEATPATADYNAPAVLSLLGLGLLAAIALGVTAAAFAARPIQTV